MDEPMAKVKAKFGAHVPRTAGSFFPPSRPPWRPTLFLDGGLEGKNGGLTKKKTKAREDGVFFLSILFPPPLRSGGSFWQAGG